MSTAIIGWSHTPFGKLDGEDVETLIVRAARAALADAAVEARDVDAIVVGHFNAGLVAQDFTASLVLSADEALRFKPATRVENACASGSAAVHLGLDRIEARRARIVLVVGVEKMTGRSTAEVGNALLRASYVKEEAEVEAGFAGLFGRLADLYFQRHGDQSDALARIAVKAHRNGAGNPFAQLRKPLSFAFCRQASDRNPVVAGPLKRTDCSPISDGAAALVLADGDVAAGAAKAVRFRARTQVNDFLPMSGRDPTLFAGAAHAWAQALAEAGATLADLDLVETHDCFTIAELIEYEAMGLVPVGQGARAILDGWTERDGRLPVNPSGGLKAKGHPVGATGVSMHVLAAMQATGTAPEAIQLPKAGLVGVFNMGGMAVANYVSLLHAGP